MHTILRFSLRLAAALPALLLWACAGITPPPVDQQAEASFEPLAEATASPYNRAVAWVPKSRAPPPGHPPRPGYR